MNSRHLPPLSYLFIIFFFHTHNIVMDCSWSVVLKFTAASDDWNKQPTLCLKDSVLFLHSISGSIQKHKQQWEKRSKICCFHASTCYRPCSISSFPSIFRFISKPFTDILTETLLKWSNKQTNAHKSLLRMYGCCCRCVWLCVCSLFWPVAAPRGHIPHPKQQQLIQKDDWPSAVAPSSAAIE